MDVKRGIANTYSSLNRNNKRNNMKDMHVHLFKHIARFENFYEMVSYISVTKKEKFYQEK